MVNTMKNTEGMPENDLKRLVFEKLYELGIDLESIRINVSKDSKIVLKGDVSSKRTQNMVRQAIIKVVGVDNLIDESIVFEGLDDYEDDDDDSHGGGTHDEDDDSYGTEDIFRSIEDGIPYIPPTEPTRQEHGNKFKRKRKKKD